MSSTPQPEQGGRRGLRARLGSVGDSVVHHRIRALVGAMAVALLICAGFTLAKPAVTGSVAQKVAPTQADISAPPTSITLKAPDRQSTAEPSRNNIAALRQQLTRVSARAAREARILNRDLDVKVAYFNMLGCYHTDHNEPHFGFLAYNFAPCSSRMPRQYAYLDDHDVTIAGVSEFQGKAYSVLGAINGGVWGMFPTHQSGAYGQNVVVWRNTDWKLLAATEIAIPYNCAHGGSCRGSSSLVLLQHRKTGRRVYVIATHHASDGGGGGASRRSAATGIDLSHVRASMANGVPVIYMGDFNEGPRLAGTLRPAFGGMGIDQIWGTPGLTFSGGGYDVSFRTMGLTDHGSGIALTAVTIPSQG